jgi:anti-sigma B factor antagonist
VSLNVALVPGPDQVVVRFTGGADLSTSPVITEALARAAQLGTRQVVVDIATTKFWDLSGLHALVAFTAELTAADRSCRIVGAPSGTRRLIGLADLADYLVLDGAVPAPPRRPAARPRPVVPARRPADGHPVPACGGQPPVVAGRLSHHDLA